jgi:hypothetical protein
LGTRGVRPFREALANGNRTLRFLNLLGNNVDDEGIEIMIETVSCNGIVTSIALGSDLDDRLENRLTRNRHLVDIKVAEKICL